MERGTDFRPLIRHPHLQTVWQTLFRRLPAVPTGAEHWETPDGDVLDVELLPDRPGAPGVIVLHGLEGSARARYVRGMLGAIAVRGWNGAALNFRSCGPTPARHARTYHSGFTADLEFAVERLRTRWPHLGVVGFSLGGNVALKWLGERGVGAGVAAAVAVSVPFDLASSAAALDGPGAWAWIYRTRFLRTLRRKARASARRFPGAFDVKRFAEARTLTEFDDRVTAPVGGFSSGRDYYARASSRGFLAAIRRPALLLSAEDDPFVPASSIPREIIARNPMLELRLLSHGGHVGFVDGTMREPQYAAERIGIAFLASHLEP